MNHVIPLSGEFQFRVCTHFCVRGCVAILCVRLVLAAEKRSVSFSPLGEVRCVDGTQMCLGFMADFFVLTHWLDSFREVALKCW
jgi:hypothetical protein